MSIARQFQPGDLIFTKMTRGFDKTDSLIVWAQKMASLLKRNISSKKDSSEWNKLVHVSIVVKVEGESVYVAEAMPVKQGSQLRVIDLLQQKSCNLAKNPNYEYEVLRANVQHVDIATTAAKIAEKMAPKVDYSKPKKTAVKSKSKFSFAKGISAIFSKQKPGLTAAGCKRLFKSIFDAKKYEDKDGLQTAMGTKGKARSFFCSYFTAHVLQQAAAYNSWKRLITENPQLGEDVSNLAQNKDPSKKTDAREISKWARQMTKTSGPELIKNMEAFTLDPKTTGPQRMRSYLSRENLFTSVFTVTPPV